MGTLSPSVDLEQSRKQAKDLLKAFRADDPETLDRIRWNHPRFRGLTDAQIRAGSFVLADAQLVIARLHYFQSWPKLLHHIETLRREDPAVLRFEGAADAIITGDVDDLRRRLRAHPALIRERSPRAHGAPLLHYVSANGVEDYRQRSPANAVDVARILLDAGAEVDATSEAYGGGWTALGLVATSTPPRIAGVQVPLIDLLLERGATLDGVRPGRSLVRAAFANGCPEAARALAERGAPLDVAAAAGVGRLDVVQSLAGSATARQLEEALIMAGQRGDADIVRWLLDRGVDVAASDGMTALHWAAGLGNLDAIDLLIERGAPLEKPNTWGGTVLGSTLWFASHAEPAAFQRIDYRAVLDRLVAAGARTDVYPGMRDDLAAVRQRAEETHLD